MPPKFQLYKDAAEKFRFRVVAENGHNVASSEAYEQYASCIKGINSVKKNCRSEVEDLTINDRKVLNPKYQIYKDAADKFRFRLKASNGEIIAQSEGYETKSAVKNGIEVVKRSHDGEIDDSEVVGKPTEEPSVSSVVREHVRPAKVATAKARVEGPEVKMPEAEMPEVKMPEVKVPVVEMPEVKAPELATPELKMPEIEKPKLETPEMKMPEVKTPEVEMPEVKVPEVEMPEVKAPELPAPEVKMPELVMPETKPVLPEVEELVEKISVSPAAAEVSKGAEVTEAKPKGMSILKELLISFVGLLIALILSALALGIANWGIGFFGITGDVAKAAAIIAVAIVIGPTIAAFATKKYF
jgi:uncharacterized protein YegP (UPF0339 family)